MKKFKIANKYLAFTFILVAVFCIIHLANAQYGYYGSSGLYGGGLYGSSLYGGYGMYGGGLYGSSMYGGGLYGSSMYGGGLYGSSMYGGYGMYGGGLYGSSMYGGGLYGSSIYGGGLYGSSMYGGYGSYGGYGYIQQVDPLIPFVTAEQVIPTLEVLLLADAVLGPILSADPVLLEILASDIILEAVVTSIPDWLLLHGYQVVGNPTDLLIYAADCSLCHPASYSALVII